MLERGLALDHVTIWRWVQRYAPVLNQRLEGERRRPNRCWPVDEACVRVAGNSVYRYRAVDLSWDVFDFCKRRETVLERESELALTWAELEQATGHTPGLP